LNYSLSQRIKLIKKGEFMLKFLKSIIILVLGFNLIFPQTKGKFKGRVTNTEGSPLPGSNIIFNSYYI
jgi:hypothetical protein